MTVSVHKDATGRKVAIALRGELTCSKHKVFREASEVTRASGFHAVVDFAKGQTLDGPGLGMGLQLNDHTVGDGAHRRVQNCSHNVREVLCISSVESLCTTR